MAAFMNVRRAKVYPQRRTYNNDDMYGKLFRFNRENVQCILNHFLNDHDDPVETRGGALSPTRKMEVFLRSLGNFKKGVGVDIDVNQSTVSQNLEEWHRWQPPLIWDDLHTDVEDAPEWQDNNGFISNTMNSDDSSWNERYPTSPFEDFLDRSSNQKTPIIREQTIINGDYSNFFTRNPANLWTKTNLRNKRNTFLLKSTKTAAKASLSIFQNSVSHHVHRRSRRDLFVRIEKLFSALSKDGKKCILKAICQANKVADKNGTMWEEIIKTIFKVKPNDQYPNEDHYDKAANMNHDCEKMYPECDGHVLSNIFRRKMRK